MIEVVGQIPIDSRLYPPLNTFSPNTAQAWIGLGSFVYELENTIPKDTQLHKDAQGRAENYFRVEASKRGLPRSLEKSVAFVKEI